MLAILDNILSISVAIFNSKIFIVQPKLGAFSKTSSLLIPSIIITLFSLYNTQASGKTDNISAIDSLNSLQMANPYNIFI